VVSPPAVEYRPAGSDPVRMSCSFGVSPRPLTISPFSVSAVSLLILPLPECSSATLLATTTPLALRHGPLPMRSRALTPASPPGAVVLRYAFQPVIFEPAALASALQCASAPSSPPRSAPLPLPVLVTKNVISPPPFFAPFAFSLSCAYPGAVMPAETRNAAATTVEIFIRPPVEWDGAGIGCSMLLSGQHEQVERYSADSCRRTIGRTIASSTSAVPSMNARLIGRVKNGEGSPRASSMARRR